MLRHPLVSVSRAYRGSTLHGCSPFFLNCRNQSATARLDNSETAHLGGKNKVKVSRASITRPTAGVVPTPFIVRIGENILDRESSELADKDAPIISQAGNMVQIELLSKMHLPVQEELPNNTPQYLERLAHAGLVHVNNDLTYTLLPLGERVVSKIRAIVDHVVHTAGYQTVDFPLVMSSTDLNRTGRVDTFKDKLMPVGQDSFLCEPMDAMLHYASRTIHSYEQLPLKMSQFARVYEKDDHVVRSRLVHDMLSVHPTHKNAHLWYKLMLDNLKDVFERLDLTQVLQSQADPGALSGNMAHEYLGVLPPKKNHDKSTCTFLKCEICGYTARDEIAIFGLNPTFDQAAHNIKMKKGPIPQSIVSDPRSVGLFPSAADAERDKLLSKEQLEKQRRLDISIRSTIAGVIKQLLPDQSRKDVPQVANLVKLRFTAKDSASRSEEPDTSYSFRNHALIMYRADRALDVRHVCRYFDCEDAEVLPASTAALMLLKFHKFKVTQHTEQKKAGRLPPSHSNPFERPTTHYHRLSVERMVELEAAGDRAGMEQEEKRVEKLNARMNVDGGLLVMVDESLVAAGIDLDSAGLERVDMTHMDAQNKDRSRGHGQLQSNPNQSLAESIQSSGMKFETEEDYAALQEQLDEVGKSVTDLEEELGIESPHILSNTEYTPELANAFKDQKQSEQGDVDDDDDDLLGLTALTTANPIQGDFVRAQDGDACVQPQCHGQGVLTSRSGLSLAKVAFLSDRMSHMLGMRYGDDDDTVKTPEMVRVTIDYENILKFLAERSDDRVLSESTAPYTIVVTAVGDVKKEPVHVGVPGFLQDQARVVEENKHIRKQRRSLQAQSVLNTKMGETKKKMREHMQENTEEKARLLGLWTWGDGNRVMHVENIAGVLNSQIGSITGDVVIDDRYTMMDESTRLKQLHAMGVPWVLVVDEQWEKQGLLRVHYCPTQTTQYLSLDYVARMFSGLVSVDERPEFDAKEADKKMKYQIEHALLSSYGMESGHKGDPNYFKIDANSDIMYDYNELDRPLADKSLELDIHKSSRLEGDDQAHGEEDFASVQKQVDQLSEEAAPEDHNATESFESQLKQAFQTSKTKVKKLGLRLPIDYMSLEQFDDKNSVPDLSTGEISEQNVAKDPYANDWLHQLGQMRGAYYPALTFSEISLMFQCGILIEPKPGVVRIDEALALANLHVVRSGMKLSYQYPQGLSESQGKAINAKKELRVDIPGSDMEVTDFALKMLRKALKKPLNTRLSARQMKEVKYEEFGIIDGDADEFELFDDNAQQQGKAEQVKTSMSSKVITKEEPQSITKTETVVPAATSFYSPPQKFSLSGLTGTKYTTRLEQAKREVAEENRRLGIQSVAEVTGIAHAVKKRSLDGTVFHESKTDQFFEKEIGEIKRRPFGEETRFHGARTGKGKFTGLSGFEKNQ